MLARRDARLHGSKRMIKLTDIESDKFDPNDPANGGVSYAKGMSAINAVHRDGRVIEGPQVFLKAYELVGLGWLFKLPNGQYSNQLLISVTNYLQSTEQI